MPTTWYEQRWQAYEHDMNTDGGHTRYARLNFIYLFLFSDYTHETAAVTNEEDDHSCQRHQQGQQIRQQLPACQQGRQQLPTPTKTTLAAPAAADANWRAYEHDINSDGRRMRYTRLNFIYFYFLTTPTKPLPPPTRRTTTAANAANKDDEYDNSCCSCQHANKDNNGCQHQQRWHWLHLQLQTPTRTTLMGTTSLKWETEGILCSPSVAHFKGNIIYFILVNLIYI